MSIFIDMMEGYKNDSFNSSDAFLDQGKELPTKLVSIYDIEFNPLNDQGDTEEELQEFAEVIYEEGQIRSPLNVYKTNVNGKKYMLLGGDRRLHALLINADKYENSQTFVPVIIEKQPENEIEEELKILQLNEHRSLTPDKEKKLVSRYLRIYRSLEEKGNKPKGQVRKWIASRMNIGEKKAEKYIHELEGYTRNVVKKEKTLISQEEKKKRRKITTEFSETLGRKVVDKGNGLFIEYQNTDDFYTILDFFGIDKNEIMDE